MDKLKKVFKNILKSKILKTIVIIIFILFIIEIILRIIGGVYLSGALSQSTENYNNSTNILVIGESSTSGLYLSYNDSYPAQLQVLLRGNYSNDNIQVIMPLFVGQNTGQVSNRIAQDIKWYHPKIIILMVGYNNEWSLAESNIGKFITGPDKFKVNLYVTLDKFRIFRVLRYAYLSIVYAKSDKAYLERLKSQDYINGGPELVQFPPKQWVYSFVNNHQKEFVELWNYDVKNIIDTAKENNITVILMTYHINPTYLSSEVFENMSKTENVTLVRNDLTFQKFIENRTINDYVLLVDYWHPNKKGYSVIANNVFNAIVDNHML